MHRQKVRGGGDGGVERLGPLGQVGERRGGVGFRRANGEALERLGDRTQLGAELLLKLQDLVVAAGLGLGGSRPLHIALLRGKLLVQLLLALFGVDALELLGRDGGATARHMVASSCWASASRGRWKAPAGEGQ